MKAIEARSIAEAARTANLAEVYESIKRFAELGDSFTHIYYNLSKEQKAELEENGYVVTDVSERNEICINISWEKTS